MPAMTIDKHGNWVPKKDLIHGRYTVSYRYESYQVNGELVYADSPFAANAKIRAQYGHTKNFSITEIAQPSMRD